VAKQPARHHKQWTKPEVQKLRTEAKGNTPTRVIALHLQRTPDAVRQKAHDEGISLKPTNQSPYNRQKK
jgi:transposase